jgi:hypothetical protein
MEVQILQLGADGVQILLLGADGGQNYADSRD